ncbi:MAG: energy transducer TonB [Bacteroidia bacterium]
MSAINFIVLAALLIPTLSFAQIPDVHDFVYVDQEPIVLNFPDVRKAIGYPAAALKKGIEGDVYCRILVDESGEYLQHKILNTSHPCLVLAVEPYLSRLKFTPARKGRQKVSYWTNIPISFSQDRSKLYLASKRQGGAFGLSYAKKAQLRLEAAEEMLADENYQASILEFTRALMYIPVARKNPQKAAVKLFGVYLGRAKAYIGKQQYERATYDLIQAIGLGSSSLEDLSISQFELAEAYNLRSYCYLALQNPIMANQDINWVLFHFVDEEQSVYLAQSQQIAVYRQLNQYEQALAVAQEAIERSPKEANAYYQKGLVLYTIGANEAAQTCFIKAKQCQLAARECQIIDDLLLQSESIVFEP